VVFGVPVMPGLTGRVWERWMATRKDLAAKLCTEEKWMSVASSRQREGMPERGQRWTDAGMPEEERRRQRDAAEAEKRQGAARR
jgi:hypothetical protein